MGPFWGAPDAVSLLEEAAIDWEVNADEIADKGGKGGNGSGWGGFVLGWLAIHE